MKLGYDEHARLVCFMLVGQFYACGSVQEHLTLVIFKKAKKNKKNKLKILRSLAL